MEILKINVKVIREGKDAWVHFCYVNPLLKRAFDDECNKSGYLNIEWLNKWSKAQFGLKVDTWEDLEKLKEAIRASYKDIYPEIFVDSPTDNQGWLRIWYTQNMKLEMNSYGV